MGKKVKKAFKSVTKAVTKVAGGNILGGNDKAKQAPEVVAAPQVQQAQKVEVAKEEVHDDIDKDTESAKKAARAKGKQGLSVARAAGSGLNV